MCVCVCVLCVQCGGMCSEYNKLCVWVLGGVFGIGCFGGNKPLFAT